MMDVWKRPESGAERRQVARVALSVLSARLPACPFAARLLRSLLSTPRFRVLDGSSDMSNSRSFLTTCVPCMTTHRDTCGLGGTRA